MTNLIEDNSYRVLGLNATANQKEILRRYKEIINRLKIEDKPVYEIDINLPEDFRTEEKVNEALKDLQSQKKNIGEYFFWFQVTNKNDQKFIDYLSEKDFTGGIKFLKELSKGEGASAFFYKKNLAILYCLLLEKEDNTKYLEESLELWEEIIKEDKSWVIFGKNYSDQNEQTASEEYISKFKKDVIKDVSDIFADLGRKNKNVRYVKEFQEKFGVFGEIIQKDVLKPTFDLINGKITEIKNIKVVQDDGQIHKKINELKGDIEFIGILFDRLKKNGLYNTNEVKVVRDHVAEAIRLKAVEINNLGEEAQEAEKLIKEAQKIAGTESYKSALGDDAGKIEKLIEGDKKSVLSINYKGFFSSKSAEFRPREVEYEGKKLLYKDITQITYNGIKRNYSATYYFTISDSQESISLTMSDLATYQKVVGIAYQVIIPRIVRRYIDKIFGEGEIVVIGELEISKTGYSRQKLFGGKDIVSWKEKIYTPQLFAGNVILYKDVDGRGRVFSRIPMTTWNAVVLPMLIRECVNKTKMVLK